MTPTAHPAVPQFTVGDRLRKAREMRGMDMAELAEMIGIHRQTLARYERDESQPRHHVIMAWAMATDVDRGWIETGQGTDRGVGGNLHSISTASADSTTYVVAPDSTRPDLAPVFVEIPLSGANGD